MIDPENNLADSAGVLAIWHDCDDSQAEAFETWYQAEHLFERLSIPGFIRGRRFEAVDAEPRFFTFYDVTGPDVLTTPAYLQSTANPTAMTTAIMKSGVRNFSRTICRVADRRGDIRGNLAVTASLSDGDAAAALYRDMAPVFDRHGVCRMQLWAQAEDSDRPASTEESLRGKDAKVAACVVIECLRPPDADAVKLAMTALLKGAAPAGIYRQLCDIESLIE